MNRDLSSIKQPVGFERRGLRLLPSSQSRRLRRLLFADRALKPCRFDRGPIALLLRECGRSPEALDKLAAELVGTGVFPDPAVCEAFVIETLRLPRHRPTAPVASADIA